MAIVPVSSKRAGKNSSSNKSGKSNTKRKKALNASSVYKQETIGGKKEARILKSAVEVGSRKSKTAIYEVIPSTTYKLLYLDLLNYGDDFIACTNIAWNIHQSLKLVQRFVTAAERSDIKIKAFIDDTFHSNEALKKWRSRREKEITTENRRIPHGFATLLGDMFRKCGVEVVYSDGVDNDDTLASHAQTDGADIMSRDKDMFRYRASTFTVHKNYEFREGKLILTDSAHSSSNGSNPYASSPRELLRVAPPTKQHTSHILENLYRRGVSTSLMKALCISPHRTITTLRRAALLATGIVGPYTEEWPEWDRVAQRVVWHVEREIVLPTSSKEEGELMLQLLGDPDRAMTHFFPEEAADRKPSRVSSKCWGRHTFCMRSLVYELCSIAHRTPLLQYWLDFEDNRKAR